MRKVLLINFFLIILTACSKSNSQPKPIPPPVNPTSPPDTTATTSIAKPIIKTNAQKVYVHYMPWFETPQTSGNGKWGQHWTMATQNPDNVQSNGQRQIASYFYPLIGPYASSDRDVIDYHLLLMKYSGIDGVIVDWYGVHDVNDYALNKRNTDSLFNRVPAAGLQFAICYEDAQLAQVKSKAGIDTVTAAKEDFAYLQSAYFGSKSYVSINNRPLLLCFGPQGMNTPSDWQQAFSNLNTKPLFLPLQDHGKLAGTNTDGEFVWVQSNNITNLTNFYQSQASSTFFAGAYPGFKDFYKPGGWGNTLFVIDHNGAATLQASLNAAKTSSTNYLQLITWNDYGEGTMIEPTTDFNFTLLQTIQQYTGVSYTDAELKLIYKWYTLRKKYKTDAAVSKQLTNAYNYLVSLDVANARNIIDGLN